MNFEGWSVDGGPAPSETAGEPLTIRHPEPAIRFGLSFDPPLEPAWRRFDLAYDVEGIVDATIALVFADGSRLPHHLAKTGRNRFTGLFRPARALARVEVQVSGSAVLDHPTSLLFAPVSAWQRRRALLRRSFEVLKGDPRSFPWRMARFVVQMSRQGRTTIPLSTPSLSPEQAYALWQDRFDERPEAEPAFHEGRARRLDPGPLFSVVAGPDFEPGDLSALAASLARQAYAAWELIAPDCVADALGPEARVRPYPRTGKPGEGLVLAIARCRGDFVLLPRPGTVLRPHALVALAATAGRFPGVKLIYADEDVLDANGRRSDPQFKPAWSPQRLAAFDYLGDPCCLATDTLLAAATRIEREAGARRHEMVLRATERLTSGEIVHVAQVLAHRAKPVPSAAGDDAEAVLRARAHRLGLRAEIKADPRSPHPRTLFALPVPPPLVSLIMPTRDRADLLRLSIGSIRAKTAYPHYEIIVVDNGSRDPETLRLFESWVGDATIRVLRHEGPFNYAALNNRAAARAEGTVLALVNNDVEVTDGGWLDEMVGLALEPGVGCVGAKLLYPEGRLQHGGVVTGIAGAAGHRNKRATGTEAGRLDDLLTVNEVSAVTAACLVVRKAIYDEVGGLDEEAFAVAYNDVDFCLKVARAGYRNLWTPFAELIHHESVSRGRDLSPRTAERFNRETASLRLRWGERLLHDPYYSPNLTMESESGAIRVQ